MKYLIQLFLLLFLINSCSEPDNTSGPSVGNPNIDKQVLFIGNSHTNFNLGLPTYVKGFAASYGINSNVRMSAPNGFTLEDHLTFQATIDLINSENWDVIILQENSYRAANETHLMLNSIESFITLLQSSGATIYLFKTWAYQDQPEMLLDLDEAYNMANAISGYQVVPIGTIWRNFSVIHTINLYEGDDVHPNIAGSYLTAAVFYKKVFNSNFLSDSSYNGQINTEDATLIKDFVSNLSL